MKTNNYVQADMDSTIPIKRKWYQYHKFPSKWYQHHKFPLIPIFWKRDEDEYNCRDFSLSWLNVVISSSMIPHIGFEIKIDGRDGYMRFYLPYLYVRITFLWFPGSWSRKGWRVKEWKMEGELKLNEEGKNIVWYDHIKDGK